MHLVALLLSIAAPAPAAAAAPSAALLDRFMAALPAEKPAEAADILGKDEVARLETLNPGRGVDLRRVLADFAACERPIVRAATMRMLRTAATRLGEAKVTQLTLFYERHEEVKFERLATAGEKAGTLGAADQAEFDRMMKDYPLRDWLQALSRLQDEAVRDEAFVAALNRCSQKKKDAMAAAKLRY
jgi:hypothetical protein